MAAYILANENRTRSAGLTRSLEWFGHTALATVCRRTADALPDSGPHVDRQEYVAIHVAESLGLQIIEAPRWSHLELSR